MWRLDADVKMTKYIKQPICLPHAFDKSDVVKVGNDFPVYTSGWGRLFSACVTNELGPVKSIKCQFPFNSGHSQEMSCARKLTPSATVRRQGRERTSYKHCFRIKIVKTFGRRRNLNIPRVLERLWPFTTKRRI